MLARERQVYIPDRVNLYYSLLSTDLNDHITVSDKTIKNSKITPGPEAKSWVQQIKVSLCLIGINDLYPQRSILGQRPDVVKIKKTMVELSQRWVCLTIAEKINSQQPIQVCDYSKIDTLITELSPDSAVLTPYLEAGIKVL